MFFVMRRFAMGRRDAGALSIFEIHSVYHVESGLGREDYARTTGGNRDDQSVS